MLFLSDNQRTFHDTDQEKRIELKPQAITCQMRPTNNTLPLRKSIQHVFICKSFTDVIRIDSYDNHAGHRERLCCLLLTKSQDAIENKL